MKKFFALTTAATMVLGLASCSSEIEAPEVQGDGNVNLTVALPGNLGTRAFSDGLTAENLDVAVYDVTDPANIKLAAERTATFGNSLQTTVSLNLANGREYKIAFFASLNGGPYTFSAENKNITVDYTKMSEYNSSDKYDCFYALYSTDGKVTAPINETITLYRPVAQVNWGTSDLEEDVLKVIYGENDLENLYTKVTTKAYTEFSLLDSDVVETSQTDVVLPLALRPAATENFPYQPVDADNKPIHTYDYLSMQYLLVPQASSIVDLKLESAASAAATETIAVVNVPNAPVQANYRTNIFGALLTNPAEFTVIKHEMYEDPDNNIPVVAVSNEADLKKALATKNAHVQLNADVNVTGLLDITNDAVIDLNGHTLKSGNVGKSAFRVNNANVIFKNGTMKDADNSTRTQYLLGVEGKSDVTFENMTLLAEYVAIPIWVRGNAEGSTVTIKSGTYKACGNSQAVYVSSKAKVVIEGGEFISLYNEDPRWMYKYTLNIYDSVLKEGAKAEEIFEVKGGKFYKYNPANADNENPIANLVPAGYKSVQDGDYYVVSAE